MEKRIYWIRFRENYNWEDIDEVCDLFGEATQWYEDNEVRFYGTSERYQEFLRAIKDIEEPIKIT